MSIAPAATTQPLDARSSHEDVLNDFVALGHKLVRLVVAQAEANTLPAEKAAAAFDRVTRSVRKSILLIRKLAEPVQAVNRIAARKQIIRTVEDTIHREAEDDEAETLQQELLDRLDTLDLDDDLGNRPVEDLIKDIVRDLGLAATFGADPWKRRTPADIAELHTRAAQPSSRERDRQRKVPPNIKAPACPPAACAPTTVPRSRSVHPSAG